MLSFASEKRYYWPLIFPGLLIGSASNALVYVGSNIALILSVPPEHSGVAGGVFNASLQLGASVGLAIATALQVSFPISPGSTAPSWHGYQASLFFSVALSVTIVILTLFFFSDPLAVKGSAGRVLAAEHDVDEKTVVPSAPAPSGA